MIKRKQENTRRREEGKPQISSGKQEGSWREPNGTHKENRRQAVGQQKGNW
jgi:hypothetical protein